MAPFEGCRRASRRVSSCKEHLVRRLFWTFPDGLPGAGLLLMRLATSGALLYRTVADWHGPALTLSLALSMTEGVSALFLLVGFWTPLWGAAVAVIELWRAHSEPGPFLVHGLLATLGGALTLLGAGARSVDARIFGWRRIDVSEARRDRARESTGGRRS
jgi:putative oxidoreductase